MIKQFSAGDITVRPFSTFKNWTVQSIDPNGTDVYGYNTYYNNKIEINEGIKLDKFFYPSSSQYFISSSEIVNPSGKYARNVYSMTDAMFYRYNDDPLKLFGVEYYTQDPETKKQEVRNIHDRIVTATLKHNVWGEKVRPYTVRIIDNSNFHETYNIFDDGYTNLYVSGSHFPSVQQLGAVRNDVALPYWNTSSGEFYVYFPSGVTQSVNYINAKQYMAMGLTVKYIEPDTGSRLFDESYHKDIFQADNEHFGESVSTWGRYIAVGSSMDSYSLSDLRLGYASLFKYDDSVSGHRLMFKINFPFTQSLTDTSSYFEDSFGYSVSIRDSFLAVGSPIGSACDCAIYPGYVCVYNKNKGGIDNWGIVNLLKGDTNGDRFGNSVALDNNLLAIGAPNASGSKGMVYIFRRYKYMDDETPCYSLETGSVWKQVVTVDDFCKEMATSSYIASQSYTPTFVSGNFSWQLEAKITSSIAAAGDRFGWAVSLDNDRLIVGTNKTGEGYATLFTCSYYSASLDACSTASWKENKRFVANSSYGDLNTSSPLYTIDVSNTAIPTNGFGTSVAISGKNIVIACPADRAFKPYASYSGSLVLGAAYFYSYVYDKYCEDFRYNLVNKSFGLREYTTSNNFAKKVSIEGDTAAVTSWADKLAYNVNYVNYSSSAYILENYSYQASASQDGVLGRVTIYNYDTTTGSWYISGDLKRNKESGNPNNIYGYSVSVGSEFMCVGAPIVNVANTSSYYDIINESTQSLYMPSTYSGSVYVYDLRKYEEDPLIGNIFYKNGHFVLTNTGSNYYNIFSGTGSAGFDLKYRGTHTIFEHEYLISVRPGEFNYSTNPSALVQNPLVFDANQDGVFDYSDVDLIMRYLRLKKFYSELVFDDNGIVLEQDTLKDYSWWGNDILQTESEDVLLQESQYAQYLISSSFSAFTNTVFNYIEKNLVSTGLLDIDGDGNINLNDGSILALYYFNKLNPTNLSPYINDASTRRYVSDIFEYLNAYCGQDTSRILPVFHDYQYSSSYDATGSYLAPYITTIGLYQDNQLVAVGKLGRPIKNLIDWPVNIVVRFDT
jgi:hypothetical protein